MIAGTLAAYLFYLLTLRWFDRNTALLLLAFLSVTPILVQDAHYARPEAFIILLVGFVYLLLNKLREGRFLYFILAVACASIGFLTATKFSLIPLAVLVFLWVPRDLWRNPSTAGRIAAVGAGATLLGMFVGVPDAFFHPGAYWSGVQFLRHQYAGVHVPFGTFSGSNTFGMMVSYFWQTFGPVLSISVIASGVTLFWTTPKIYWVSICLPIAFYLAAFSTQRTFFERNLSHIVPLMLMLSAAGLMFTVRYVRSRTAIRWIPPVLAVVLLVSAIAPPALLSTKLVFVAMATTNEARAKEYEDGVLRKTGKSIARSDSLIFSEQVTDLAQFVEDNDSDVLVRLLDYNDPFTAHNISELGRRVRLKQIGYFPSIFSNLTVNSLFSHSVALRYLLLGPGTKTRTAVTEIGGWKFSNFKRAFQQMQPGRVEMNSWVPNGVYPEVGFPRVKGQFFGSWINSTGDRNMGTLRMGPIRLAGSFTIGIPIVTGPVNQGLSVKVKDHNTGAELAHMDPPPVLTTWKLWRIDLPHEDKLMLDIIASDQGSGFGQWLAVGAPYDISESFTKLGAVLGSVLINGSWTRDGYYPDVGPPPVHGEVYGSWSGGDANVGTLRLGPFYTNRQTAIVIPLVTGPNNGGLSVKVLNTRTGKVIASLNPLPLHTNWWAWTVALPPDPDATIEIVADDSGTGWGQWLAVGLPHAVQ